MVIDVSNHRLYPKQRNKMLNRMRTKVQLRVSPVLCVENSLDEIMCSGKVLWKKHHIMRSTKSYTKDLFCNKNYIVSCDKNFNWICLSSNSLRTNKELRSSQNCYGLYYGIPIPTIKLKLHRFHGLKLNKENKKSIKCEM